MSAPSEAGNRTAVVVLKVGGEVVASPAMARVAAGVAALRRAGEHVLIVHGGGQQATDLQKRLGQTPRVVAGRRITDAETLEVMKMTVAGKVNVDACATLLAEGLEPVGLHGASALTVRAVKRPPRVVTGGGPDPVDFGHVGDVAGVNARLLALLVGAGFVPVIACLGADEQGRTYNINADVVGSQLAVALGAKALVLVSDVPGVLRDVRDPASRIPRLSVEDAKRAIAVGTVSKGMIPKLVESFAAIAQGVKDVHIVSAVEPHQLLGEVQYPGTVGTVLFE